MGSLAWIVLGLIAGFLAGQVMRGGYGGRVMIPNNLRAGLTSAPAL